MIEKNYALMNLPLNTYELQDYIIKINYQISKEEALAISNTIINVSDCFQIDPWLMMSLIQKESSFNKNATSPTGAAGLTQFTEIGLREVNDQLGFNGRAGATDAVTVYFSRKIKTCIKANWIDLWTRVKLKPNDPDFYNLMKVEIKKDITTSITYGAILLKTYLAYVANKNINSPQAMKRSEMYFEALQMYNGEPGDAKVQYAKDIFLNIQAAYPKPVDFKF
jgi:hypothetical protein